nr:DUF4214 domain-containing protein [Tianweitania sediminis]
MINRARANPLSEATSLGIDLNQGLASSSINSDGKQPLVFNATLLDAARSHSGWMLDTDIFSHIGVNGSNPGNRMAAAGYNFAAPSGWAENIAYTGTTGVLDPKTHTLQNHENLFRSPGHRVNLMDADFKEIGMATQVGEFSSDGRVFKTMMVTENFAFSGSQSYLTGVVLDDRDRDKFYDVGEGVGGATIKASGTGGSFETSTWGAGGYSLALPSGTYTVTVGYAGRESTTTVSIGSQNLKLDAMLADMQAATIARTEDSGPNVPLGVIFTGTEGSSVYQGTSGLDAIVYEGVHSGFTWSLDTSGGLALNKPSGDRDMLLAIERIGFADGVLAVDVGIDDTAGQAYRIYQAAFDRTPDAAGLIYWIDRMDDGLSLGDVAKGFLASQEFASIYGTGVSAIDFVDRLYENVLGRSGEAAGLEYWVEQLDTGAQDAVDVLVGFSQSAENVALVGQAISNGVWLPGAQFA